MIMFGYENNSPIDLTTIGVTVWKSSSNQFLDDSNQEVDQFGRQSTLHWIRMTQRGRGCILDEHFVFRIFIENQTSTSHHLHARQSVTQKNPNELNESR